MNSNRKLICLFGMPRSGTTWIGKIFDSHPDTLYMHEPDSWQHLNNIPLFPSKNYSCECLKELKNVVSGFPVVTKAQVTSKLPIFKKNYQSYIRFYAYKASLYYTSVYHKFRIPGEVNTIKRVSSDCSTSYSIVWKSIESLGRLAFFAKELENVSCIHIVRNPAGYISSVLNGESNKLFQGSTSSSEDYNLFQMLLETEQGTKLGYTLTDLKGFEPIERLAIRWQIYNEIAYENGKDLDNYQLLIYEDLCRNPVDKVQQLFKFCGLDWNNQTSLFVGESISQNKDAYYSVFKSPLDAAYKWKNNLGNDDINKINKILTGSIPFSWFANDFESFSE